MFFCCKGLLHAELGCWQWVEGETVLWYSSPFKQGYLLQMHYSTEIWEIQWYQFYVSTMPPTHHNLTEWNIHYDPRPDSCPAMLSFLIQAIVQRRCICAWWTVINGSHDSRLVTPKKHPKTGGCSFWLTHAAITRDAKSGNHPQTGERLQEVFSSVLILQWILEASMLQISIPWMKNHYMNKCGKIRKNNIITLTEYHRHIGLIIIQISEELSMNAWDGAM